VLEQLHVLDDTLVFYLIGDNGASAEGTAAARCPASVRATNR
jgi:arylsulfatase A-like enzyme